MKSVKLKVSLIANLIAVVCLIILGVVTFMFVKQAIFHEVVKAETNYVKTAKNSMESFKARNSLALESLAKSILKHPVEQLDNQDALMHYVGKDLKNFRDAGRFLAVYIAQPNGELVVSDPDSDAKNLDFGTYGKADNYDARTREYYIEAVKTNKLYITPSYIDVTTNLPCFTYSIPLYKDGKFIGVLAVDILAADLQAEFEIYQVELLYLMKKIKYLFLQTKLFYKKVMILVQLQILLKLKRILNLLSILDQKMVMKDLLYAQRFLEFILLALESQ